MNEEEVNDLLTDGDDLEPISLDDYVETIELHNRYYAMKLKNGMEDLTRFKEYLHNPLMEVECYLDKTTDEYVYSVKPIEGYAFQQAINEKFGIEE